MKHLLCGILLSVLLSGCATSLGAKLGLHRSMSDEMIFDALKSHHDQLIVDHYSAAGSNAATLMKWVGMKADPDQAPFLTELRKEMVNRNPQWPAKVKQAVVEGKVIRGMDEKQVLSVWGTPSEKQNAQLGKKYSMETWQYIAHSHATSLQAMGVTYKGSAARGGVKYYGMVLFRSGRVTSIQTFQ